MKRRKLIPSIEPSSVNFTKRCNLTAAGGSILPLCGSPSCLLYHYLVHVKSPPRLPRSFYLNPDVIQVTQLLLGKLLWSCQNPFGGDGHPTPSNTGSTVTPQVHGPIDAYSSMQQQQQQPPPPPPPPVSESILSLSESILSLNKTVVLSSTTRPRCSRRSHQTFKEKNIINNKPTIIDLAPSLTFNGCGVANGMGCCCCYYCISRIVECEAYRAPDDKASHAYQYKHTNKNNSMFKKGGTAYVYVCYGIHYMLNVISNVENEPHAILLRAAEPIAFFDSFNDVKKRGSENQLLRVETSTLENQVEKTRSSIKKKRKSPTRKRGSKVANPDLMSLSPDLCKGPGCLTRAMQIQRTWDGHDLIDGFNVWITECPDWRDIITYYTRHYDQLVQPAGLPYNNTVCGICGDLPGIFFVTNQKSSSTASGDGIVSNHIVNSVVDGCENFNAFSNLELYFKKNLWESYGGQPGTSAQPCHSRIGKELKVTKTARIGISYAEEYTLMDWRMYIEGHKSVSRPIKKNKPDIDAVETMTTTTTTT